jgi:hypothetical protein
MNMHNLSKRIALSLMLLGVVACSQAPKGSEDSKSETPSLNAQQQACVNLSRQIRLVCRDNLKGVRGREGSARTNYDCMSARLEFQKACI